MKKRFPADSRPPSFRSHWYGITLIVVLTVGMLAFTHPGMDRLLLRMESQSVQGGKMASVEATLFYQSLDGKMVTVFDKPQGQVMITNRLGEMEVYSMSDNTVFRAQGEEYSSENNLIYFFLSGRMHDLGLSALGFDQMETAFRDGLVITQWMPPSALSHLFHRIELVHSNHLPIYVAYYDASRRLVKKVYYADYRAYAELDLPHTIIEYNYFATGDSIVNRVKFSEVLTGQSAQSEWFDFDIPHDATIVEP